MYFQTTFFFFLGRPAPGSQFLARARGWGGPAFCFGVQRTRTVCWPSARLLLYEHVLPARQNPWLWVADCAPTSRSHIGTIWRPSDLPREGEPDHYDGSSPLPNRGGKRASRRADIDTSGVQLSQAALSRKLDKHAHILALNQPSGKALTPQAKDALTQAKLTSKAHADKAAAAPLADLLLSDKQLAARDADKTQPIDTPDTARLQKRQRRRDDDKEGKGAGICHQDPRR